jgi:hypothetical protein
VIGVAGTLWGSALYFGPGALLALVLICLGLRRRMYRELGLAMLVSPMSFGFVHGVVDYAHGSPRLRTMGLPNFVEGDNPDLIYRVPWSSGGCMVHGGEPLIRAPHNAGVRACIALFGFPPGSYEGTYPTREEANALGLTVGPSLPFDVLDAREVELEVGDRRVRLGRWVGPALASAFYGGEDSDSFKIRPRLFGDRVLVLSVWMTFFEPEDGGSGPELVVLVDTESGWPFAYYGDGMAIDSNRLPRWQRPIWPFEVVDRAGGYEARIVDGPACRGRVEAERRDAVDALARALRRCRGSQRDGVLVDVTHLVR